MIRSPALLALLILLALPSVAQADMAVGFQDDGTIVDGHGIGREAALDLVQCVEGRWVRIIIQEQDWHKRHSHYREAAAAIKARGCKVMVTPMRWRGLDGNERSGATAAEWERFMSSAVPYLAPYVDAWGSSNEPQLAAFSPHADITCTMGPGVEQKTDVINGRTVIVRYRKVGKGKGKYKRVVRWVKVDKKGTHRRVGNRYVKAAKRAKYMRRVIFKRKTGGGYKRIVRRVPRYATVRVSTPYDFQICMAQARAIAYRRIHDLSARIVRVQDPTALMIVGDLAPAVQSVEFMQTLFAASSRPVDADAVGIHPYAPVPDPTNQYGESAFYITNIEQAVDQVKRWHAAGRITGDQTWITEYGLNRDAPARHWTDALARAEAAGVRVMILYEITVHVDPNWPWNTGIWNADGSPRPAANAVKGWIDR